MFSTSLNRRLRVLTEILLLVLMAWHAPIPVAHRHDDWSAGELNNLVVLHLEQHHGEQSGMQSDPRGWHWHWVCPGDRYVGPVGEVVVASGDDLIPGPTVDLPSLTEHRLIAFLEADRGNPLVKLPLRCRYSFQCVALLGSRQSLPELLGTMLI